MSNDNSRQKEIYNNYVNQITPKHNLPKNMAKAFLVGGIICTIGQVILEFAGSMNIEKDIAASWCSMCLIFISVVLTCFNLFGPIAKFGGAGALVPITGFANGVVSSAIEYKKEGQVFGIGCKIFIIAGPVILYGIFTSWVLGLIYWICKIIGIL